MAHELTEVRPEQIMDIKGASLFNEMQAMANKAGGIGSVESMPGLNKVQSTDQADFSSLLKEAVDNVNGLQMQSKELATRFDMGDRSIDLSDVMLASNKAGLAFDATIQVRNKLVEAYKQVMSMPI